MTTQQRSSLLGLAEALCGGEMAVGGNFDVSDWMVLSDGDLLDRLTRLWVAIEDNVSFAHGEVPGGELRWCCTFVVPEVCPWDMHDARWYA